MSDEHEIPIKVVDRRWWANTNSAESGADGAASGTSLKPTYVEQLEAQLAEKDRQLQEHIAKYRQTAAEFDESRIRLRREISKDVERARREVLAEVLEVLDNLDRAADSAATAPSIDAVVQGVDMVRRQFLATLEGLGVTRIDAVNRPFDPTLHEAITSVPAASPAEDGVVAGVIRHGYRVGQDVLRPAAVAVTKIG
jgi:molecular chaperone GrpE